MMQRKTKIQCAECGREGSIHTFHTDKPAQYLDVCAECLNKIVNEYFKKYD